MQSHYVKNDRHRAVVFLWRKIMKLSIIVPAYNAGHSIRRCLDSIPIRDDIEAIVIDDGSDDNTAEILQDYEENFRIIYGLENKGVSYARNIGMEKAKGEYITFLDADDELLPDGIDAMLRAMDLDENIVQFNHLRDGSTAPWFFAKAGTYDLDNLPQKWVLVWNKIYKRSFIEEHNITFPEGQQFEEDRIFNFKCFRHSPRLVVLRDKVVDKHKSMESLCHTVTADKLLITAQAELDMLKEEQDEKMRRLIWSCLADLINSTRFVREFGNGKT